MNANVRWSNPHKTKVSNFNPKLQTTNFKTDTIPNGNTRLTFPRVKCLFTFAQISIPIASLQTVTQGA